MKLATLNNHTRDGQLIVVDKQLKQFAYANDIAKTMQEALDNWSQVNTSLEERYHALNEKRIDSFPFEVNNVLSPLPRAYQWADASAYVTHVELMRKTRGETLPENFWVDPLMYQGGSDHFFSPREKIAGFDPKWGIDFEAEVAVITNDVKMGTSVEDAGKQILLIMLANDVSLRYLIPSELAKGFGFFQGKPASAFSPVAVTPDELGSAWRDYKVHLPMRTYYNEKLFGQPNAGVDMVFNFAQLIAHAAKTRELCAGSIIGSGTVSNSDHSVGSSCIAEVRMLEKLKFGEAKSHFMQPEDSVRIEMLDESGHNIFGSIEQEVI
ncbi:MAG: fumarylacetoacetate hydrolase family protein [Gammaproteobacteria bacterium]